MIISGGSRTNYRFFAVHLMNAQDNERIHVVEIRGLISDNVPEALREIDAIGSGSAAKNRFYHAAVNPPADKHLTEAQWEIAVDTLERNLGLEGQARFVVEHTKEDRTHRHIVWSRIDPDTMKAVSDSHNFRIHEQTSRELEAQFGHVPVVGAFNRDADEKRPDRRPENWEVFRGHRSKIDPKDVKEEVTALWNASDSGAAFAAALETQGYLLCKGDRRDFVILDAVGDLHSLTRRIEGVKAAAVRARMADIDNDELPSVEHGRALIAEHRRAADEAAQRNQDAAIPVASPHAIAVKEEQQNAGTSYIESVFGDVPAPLWTIEEINEGNAAQQREGRKGAEHIPDYASPINEALRRGEDVPARDGLSWFARMQTMFSSTVEVVSEWAKDRFDSFIEMVRSKRDDTPDTPDSNEPEIGG